MLGLSCIICVCVCVCVYLLEHMHKKLRVGHGISIRYLPLNLRKALRQDLLFNWKVAILASLAARKLSGSACLYSQC